MSSSAHEVPAPVAERPGKAVCDGSGELEVCLTRVPHTHCVCGMPMQRGRLYCPYCVDEKALSLTRFEREVREGVMSSRGSNLGGWSRGHLRSIHVKGDG